MAVDKNMDIIVVDDFKTMVQLTKGLLSQMGFKNVDEAADGKEALAKIKNKKYGLILSDWNMEPMTGLELLKAVRADDAIKHIPMILITAESKPQNIIAAKQAGVNNYIVKPVTGKALKEKMSAVLGAID